MAAGRAHDRQPFALVWHEEAMKPCILVTNDDGIHSPGLRAAVSALAPLGDLVVVAPLEQYSGAGRSFAQGSRGRIEPVEISWAGGSVQAYGVDGSPTQAALHGLVEFSPRRPDLAVVGINYGENLGNGITASGTVGAALEMASAGVPALAVSRQVASKYYLTHSTEIDFAAAAHFVQMFARRLLASNTGLAKDVDLLKIDVPDTASPTTPWQVTRVSRQRYFEILPPERESIDGEGPLRYRISVDEASLERDSDIYALIYDRVVSVAPVSMDLSSRVDRGRLQRLLDDVAG
jgi:5'-nucleotidase